MSRQVTTLKVTEKTVGPKYNPTTKLGNWDSSRTTINKIIIHTMVGSAQSADTRFNDPASNVSAHYGVLLTGEIWHWVDEDKNAYHAGAYNINQESIGIEHEDNGDYNGIRPDTLYNASGALVKEICNFYNIPIDRQHILGHREVHATACPDTLDIDRIVSIAQGNVSLPVPGMTLDQCQIQLALERKTKEETWQELQQVKQQLTQVQNEFDGANAQIKSLNDQQHEYAARLKCDNQPAAIDGEIDKLLGEEDQLTKVLTDNQTLKTSEATLTTETAQLQEKANNLTLTNNAQAKSLDEATTTINQLKDQLTKVQQQYKPLVEVLGLVICTKIK